jgi:hypothetical protein
MEGSSSTTKRGSFLFFSRNKDENVLKIFINFKMSEEFWTMDSLLLESEIADQTAVDNEVIHTPSPAPSISATDDEDFEPRLSIQRPYSQEISLAIRCAVASNENDLLDCFSVDSFSDLVSHVLTTLNLRPGLKPEDSIEKQVMEDAAKLTAKLDAQAGIIEALSQRFKEVQQLVRQQAGEIDVSNAEIMRLQNEFGRSTDIVSPSSSRVTAAHGKRSKTGVRTQDTLAEEAYDSMSGEVQNVGFEEFPSEADGRPTGPQPGSFFIPEESDGLDYLLMKQL